MTRADAEAEANFRLTDEEASQAKEDEFLCDADTLQDWLCGHMIGIQGAHVNHVNVPSDPVDLCDYIVALDPGQLFTLAIQQPWHAPRAMSELQDRYLKFRWGTAQ